MQAGRLGGEDCGVQVSVDTHVVSLGHREGVWGFWCWGSHGVHEFPVGGTGGVLRRPCTSARHVLVLRVEEGITRDGWPRRPDLVRDGSVIVA